VGPVFQQLYNIHVQEKALSTEYDRQIDAAKKGDQKHSLLLIQTSQKATACVHSWMVQCMNIVIRR